MRRLALLFAGGAVWLLLAAIPVFADNGPHGTTGTVISDGCAGCHRAHRGVAANLLVDTEPNLCYTCHGSVATGARTDVVDGVGFDAGTTTVRGGTRTGALRGGGFTYALIKSDTPSGQGTGGQVGTSPTIGVISPLTSTPAVTSTHTLGAATLWGAGAAGSGAGTSVTLKCTSCHEPHGGANTAGATAADKKTYRILRPLPAIGSGTAVPIADVTDTTYDYTTLNYWTVGDSHAASYIANVSAWCSTCHTRYLAASGTAPETTPLASETIFTYRHRSDGTVQAATGAKTTPTCVQCHVAHGSNAAMSGAYSSKVEDPGAAIGSGTGTPSKLLRIDNRGICQMCHNR